MNYLQGSRQRPYHISVGAVVLDEENKVLCHYYKEVREFKDLYLLMRETVEPNETMEETLTRGLKEEFGVTAEIIGFIGATTTNELWFEEDPIEVKKTTIYFLTRLISIDPALRDEESPESSSEIRHETPQFLIEKMKAQGKQHPTAGIDESQILENMIKYLSTQKSEVSH